MSTRRRPLQKKTAYNKIKNQFLNSGVWQQVTHVLSCLKYLLGVLIAGIIIHKSWNALMVAFFDGNYQIGMFEAAILWACVF